MVEDRVGSRHAGWRLLHRSKWEGLIPQTRMLTEVVGSGLYLEGKPSLVF